MNTENQYISFPPGAITDGPLRLTLLWRAEAGLALNKPPGLAAFQDTRVGGGARSILTEINARVTAGSPQFEKLGIKSLFALNQLEREASGVLLCANGSEARASLKNAMGSSQFTFRYRFFSAAEFSGNTASCELPVAVHREKPLALISHRTGKKATTLFRRLEAFGSCSLWESESVYDRFHQVRLHAAEAGLPALSDPIYGNVHGKSAAATRSPGDAGFLLHLNSVSFPFEENRVDLEAPYPKPFRMFLKKLL